MNCPTCSQPMMGVEYSYDSPERYDGVSEWWCKPCDIRIGRWSGKVLKGKEIEKRYGGKV